MTGCCSVRDHRGRSSDVRAGACVVTAVSPAVEAVHLSSGPVPSPPRRLGARQVAQLSVSACVAA